jgi:hypothetical protein
LILGRAGFSTVSSTVGLVQALCVYKNNVYSHEIINLKEKIMQKGLTIIILFLSFKITFSQQFTDLYGEYLGQIPPGDSSVVFAPGIISSDYAEHCAPAFSPDGNEVFWWVCMIPGSGDEKWISKGMTMKRIGNRWTSPTVSPYYGEVFFSSDGKRLYFAGLYPDHKGDGPYMVEKENDKWSEPKNLGLVARFPELKKVMCPSVTQNGTLYFAGDIVGQSMSEDIRIYRSKLIDGEYTNLELLPPSINLPDTWNGTPFIAPDESYLIFNSKRESNGDGDLFISFHNLDTDTWSEPVTMDIPGERYPGLSPDGKYFFFTRFTRFSPPVYDNDIFWISAEIIDKLRDKSVEK